MPRISRARTSYACCTPPQSASLHAVRSLGTVVAASIKTSPTPRNWSGKHVLSQTCSNASRGQMYPSTPASRLHGSFTTVQKSPHTSKPQTTAKTPQVFPSASSQQTSEKKSWTSPTAPLPLRQSIKHCHASAPKPTQTRQLTNEARPSSFAKQSRVSSQTHDALSPNVSPCLMGAFSN